VPKPTSFTEFSAPAQAPITLRKLNEITWTVEKDGEELCHLEGKRFFRPKWDLRITGSSRTWIVHRRQVLRWRDGTEITAEGYTEDSKEPALILYPRSIQLGSEEITWRPTAARTTAYFREEPILEFADAWQGQKDILYNIWPHQIPITLPQEILYALPLLKKFTYETIAKPPFS